MPVNPHSGELLAESPAAVAEVFLSRVREALAACPTSEALVASYVVAGELAWDDCCGVLVAAPLRTFRTQSFPTPASDHTNCDTTLLAVEVVVILLRCAPSIDTLGRPPTPEEMDESFTATLGDAAVVYNAVTGELPKGWERANVEQTFVGADGGCIAVDTRLTIGLPQSFWCACPVDEEP